jgi:hypothetical protein
MFTTLSLVTALAVSAPYTNNVDTSTHLATYDQSVNYNINKQSTVDKSKVKNDIEMLRLLEIEDFNNELQSKFETTIVNTWIPADGFLEKNCLFVSVENQEELINSSEDFETDLYLALEEKINRSNFFDMIALM